MERVLEKEAERKRLAAATKAATKGKKGIANVHPVPEEQSATVPRLVQVIDRLLSCFSIGVHYGLFASLTKSREELIIEVSDGDGKNWRPVRFRYKPGSDLDSSSSSSSLKFVYFLHMPRLDFACWYLSLKPVPCERWFLRLVLGIISGNRDIVSLLDPVESERSVPELIRVRLVSFKYCFNTVGLGQWKQSDDSEGLHIIGESSTEDIIQRIAALDDELN
jgi:hypothetical protein